MYVCVYLVMYVFMYLFSYVCICYFIIGQVGWHRSIYLARCRLAGLLEILLSAA